MAHYCTKCGRSLPDGVDVCIACEASESRRTEAAPFTRLSAETEVWKDSSESLKRPSIKKSLSLKTVMISAAAIVIVAAGILSYVLTRPGVRVVNALSSENYEKALVLFKENYIVGRGPENVQRKLHKIANEQYWGFMNEEISAEEADATFQQLFNFTKIDNSLNGKYYAFLNLVDSKEKGKEAALCESEGRYLDACDLYAQVIELDNKYEASREAFTRCVEGYAAEVVIEADKLIVDNEYSEAIAVLKAANDELHKRETFSPTIDQFLLDCFDGYEDFVVTESKILAEAEEYGEAAALITQYFEVYERDNEELGSVLEEYEELARKKLVSSAVDKSDELYEQKEYAEAFAELDKAAENEDIEELIEVSISNLEKRFTNDMMQEAESMIAEDNSKFKEATKLIEEAVSIRSTPKLEAYLEYLEDAIAIDLITTTNCEKQGVIYRDTASFDCVDGTKYTDGWIWGENQSAVTYKLNGEYESFYGTFAVRRSDGAQKQANFEVWLDGKKVYISDILYATETKMPFEIDVTGAKEMKIVFFANYKTSGTQGGYCCHGLCTPILQKPIAEFEYED